MTDPIESVFNAIGSKLPFTSDVDDDWTQPIDALRFRLGLAERFLQSRP
ncbi:hypothetical protein [Sulfitobacter undariae]|nr:hypothetical protein [Sulfitobacter undariae]